MVQQKNKSTYCNFLFLFNCVKDKKIKERKFPIKEKQKKRKGNSQSKSGRKQKEKKEVPNQRMGERKKSVYARGVKRKV